MWLSKDGGVTFKPVFDKHAMSIGAIREAYIGALRTPLSFQLRIAETAGQWNVVVPTQSLDASVQRNPYEVTSEFNAIRTRYIELTMTGTRASGQVWLNELFVFPSAPLDPPPSTMDGYDLTSLAGVTATYNTNMFGSPAQKLLDKNLITWVAGKSLAQGASGDGVVNIDLGGWFAISQVAMMFDVQSNWTTGGKIEVSFDQVNWTSVYDSGRGTLFGSTALGAQIFTFTKQVARYVRITDYFVATQGVGSGALSEVQVF